MATLRHYPPKFGFKVLKINMEFGKTSHDPSAGFESKGAQPDLQTLFQTEEWADVWEDAGMPEVIQYLMGNKYLQLPSSWRMLFPEEI